MKLYTLFPRIIKKIKYELQFNNTSYYTRISDKVHKTLYTKILRKKLLSLAPITLQKDNARLTLSILANNKNFFPSMAAIYSFSFWNRNIHVNYHEDGTLDDRQIAILKEKFPGITVLRRKEHEPAVIKYLQTNNFEACVKLRKAFVLSLKLFDTVFAKKTDYALLIDSDVLFFSNPREIMDIVELGKLNGGYNRDKFNAYVFSNEILKKYIDLPMVECLNSGVFLHNLDHSFFSFVENVLRHELTETIPWHIEQTLFAMYVTHKGGFVELPKEYDLARKERDKGKKIISEHYVHNAGYDQHKDFIYKLYPVYNNAVNE